MFFAIQNITIQAYRKQMKIQQHSGSIRHFMGTTAVLCTSFFGVAGGSIAMAEPDTGNKVEAFDWYRKAAEQGYARAQNNLGEFYERGWGEKI